MVAKLIQKGERDRQHGDCEVEIDKDAEVDGVRWLESSLFLACEPQDQGMGQRNIVTDCCEVAGYGILGQQEDPRWRAES